MTSVRCPAGHSSTSVDYCDVCGAPIDSAAAPQPDPPAVSTPSTPATPAATGGSAAAGGSAAPAPTTSTPTKECDNCGAANAGDALFCEDCGYDFTTGQLPVATPATPAAPSPSSPGAPPAAAVEWVAEVWVDPEWYARNRDDTTEPCPPAGTPKVAPLAGTGALIGRPSTSRQIHPQIDCTPDSGVSRRHAQLLFDRDRWFVEDLGSTNGTFVAGAGVLPTDPIPSGQRRELGDNDRIFIGAWTRIVVRRAIANESGSTTTGDTAGGS